VKFNLDYVIEMSKNKQKERETEMKENNKSIFWFCSKYIEGKKELKKGCYSIYHTTSLKG
jgi:hypothetical protein